MFSTQENSSVSDINAVCANTDMLGTYLNAQDDDYAVGQQADKAEAALIALKQELEALISKHSSVFAELDETPACRHFDDFKNGLCESFSDLVHGKSQDIGVELPVSELEA